ncbi:Polyketide cyclase/dehydrase and lipid transport superfamily protein [Prunus dulcis]|uniref:Polyketide cyclase/dehydrase and lipid transport superfamily protein n=1 Tax=Prunus dulcis TaxID=3755 RepID=A0A4Y1R3M6_PRUDU|nr:Polyketide cyclase/dehydrase and lipid transport superfamily protein [Prunus dulcis]
MPHMKIIVLLLTVRYVVAEHSGLYPANCPIGDFDAFEFFAKHKPKLHKLLMSLYNYAISEPENSKETTEMVKIVDLRRVHGMFQGSSEEFWRENVYGGFATLVALLFVLAWHCAKRFVFRKSSSSKSSPVGVSNSDPTSSGFSISEMVTDADLKFLIENLEEKTRENEKWDNVIEKRNDLLSYYAKCCKPKDGPVKYLSSTIFENCSPEKLRDFYMDNDYRKQWDKMLIEHEQLQVDKNKGVEVGRSIKKFPLLTAREYVLAWRLWEGKDNTFYCFIKECEHPLAPPQKKYVRVMPGRNACEIKMFHQEDAGLNVEMAKLAFSRGIWSYVCKMDTALRRYSRISNHPLSSGATAVTLIKKVPPGLEATDSMTSQENSAATSVHRPIAGGGRKLSRTPSKKLLANGLLILGVWSACLVGPSTKKTDHYTTFAKMRNGGKGRGLFLLGELHLSTGN